MKYFLILLAFTPLFLSSCSSDEAITSDSESKMLESYVIKRNANGSYTLKHLVSQGVNTVYNDNDKNNDVILFFDGEAVQTEFNHDYLMTNNELNINFSSENNSHQPKIKLIDDNSNQKSDFGLLNDYEMVQNSNGTITLNYVVKPGVSVTYGFDNNENINEIILAEDSAATQTTYSKTYTKEVNSILKIDFIQPLESKDEGSEIKKPRLFITTD